MLLLNYPDLVSRGTHNLLQAFLSVIASGVAARKPE
jgi:hypothetical protein